VLAVIAAVLLILLALVVRNRRESSQAADEAAANAINGTVVCVMELSAVCTELHENHPDLTVRVEPAGTTIAQLTDSGFDAKKVGIDAWLAPVALAQSVEAQRQANNRGSVLGDSSPVIARSPVVMAIWNDQDATLRAACPGGDVTWKCIGDQVTTNADLKPGIPDPVQTATGQLVLAEATNSYVGQATYGSNDLEQPAYLDWLSRLQSASNAVTNNNADPLSTMLAQGPSTYSLVGDLEAHAGPAVAGDARDKDKLTVLYPAPIVTADLVVTPVQSSSAGGRVVKLFESDEVAQDLAKQGWVVPNQPLAPGIRGDALPATNGLAPGPSAADQGGVLAALVNAWKSV
jgi:hypothetical protein